MAGEWEEAQTQAHTQTQKPSTPSRHLQVKFDREQGTNDGRAGTMALGTWLFSLFGIWCGIEFLQRGVSVYPGLKRAPLARLIVARSARTTG